MTGFGWGTLFSAQPQPIASRCFPQQKRGDSFAGSLIGYLAKTGDISLENLKRAIVYGSVVASTTVQDFSLASLRELKIEEVERRYEVVRGMSAF